MVTFVPPGAAVALADAVADADSDAELELSDELAELDDVDDLSPDEQPDRPAMTIAAPPYCDQQPMLHGRSPLVSVTRQDQRIIPRTMARASARVMRLPKNALWIG